MCGEAPVTPPAQACSPRLDGKPTYCPDERDLILKPVELPKEQLKGEIDIYNPHHWQSTVSYTHLTLPTILLV